MHSLGGSGDNDGSKMSVQCELLLRVLVEFWLEGNTVFRPGILKEVGYKRDMTSAARCLNTRFFPRPSGKLRALVRVKLGCLVHFLYSLLLTRCVVKPLCPTGRLKYPLRTA